MAQIRANGIDIEYEVAGPRDGIPFLLIHGFAQQLIAWPPEFIDALTAAGLRVVTFDNRDVGLTQKWDGVVPDVQRAAAQARAGGKPDVPYRLADMAADCAGLLDALDIDSAHIMGASMGGMIAQLVALDYPDKTRSLISMFSTTGDPDLPPSTPEALAALMTQADARDRDTVIASTLKARRAYASIGWPYNVERISAGVGAAYDRMYYPEGTLRHWAAIMTSPPRGERLRSLDKPALVMHGGADTLVRPEAGRRTAQCIAGAEYHEIEGWGHDLPLGLIPRVVGYIVDFVKRVEAAGHFRHGRP